MPDYSLKLDYAYMMEELIGAESGIGAGAFDRSVSKGVEAVEALKRMAREGVLGFAGLPFDKKLPGEVMSFADVIADEVDNFIVLGIGGSALGNIALHMALNHSYHNSLPREKRNNRPRIFVIDNVDPEFIAGVLDILDLKTMAINIISKSGSTAETMAQALLFLKELQNRIGRDKMRERVIATTDSGRGALWELAQREGYRTFAVPPGVGGRFSVLSAVGLLSAAVSGIDIGELLEGARVMHEACFKSEVSSNPAMAAAVLQYVAYMSKGKSITVMMPYANALLGVADWYRQLWAESLGKRIDRAGKVVYTGQTPIKALGTTDQHSQVQLYMEGPCDKVITFLSVKEYRSAVSIPGSAFDSEALNYLTGSTMNNLIHAEQRATAMALAQTGRPNMTIEIERIAARTIGMILYMLEVQTALAGELYGIDAFNQPGVERGKKLTYAMMRRDGYEHLREEIEQIEGRRVDGYEIAVR